MNKILYNDYSLMNGNIQKKLEYPCHSRERKKLEYPCHSMELKKLLAILYRIANIY